MKLNAGLLFTIFILLFCGCRKDSDTSMPAQQQTVDPVDTIVGTYTGILHATSYNQTDGYPATYTDTTYITTIVVSKVAADSFHSDIFITGYNNGSTYVSSYAVPYDPSDFYTGIAPGNIYNEMKFVSGVDSLYYNYTENNSSHFSTWDIKKYFAGKKN